MVDQGADQGHLQAGGEGEECEEDGQDGAEVPTAKGHLQELLKRGLSCAGLAIHEEGCSVVGGNLQSAFSITDLDGIRSLLQTQIIQMEFRPCQLR